MANPCPYCGGSGQVHGHIGTVMAVPSMGWSTASARGMVYVGGGAGGASGYGGGNGGAGTITYAGTGGGAGDQYAFNLQPPPLPTQPIEAGELVGYRVWRVDADCDLFSYSWGSRWWPGVFMNDREKCDEEIGDTNSVGVWAFKEPKDAIDLLRSDPTLVFGSVWMWGTVIEHKKGYRAQFAAIRSLDHYNELATKLKPLKWSWWAGKSFVDGPTVLEQLRQKYGVGDVRDVDKYFPLVKET